MYVEEVYYEATVEDPARIVRLGNARRKRIVRQW
jgi:hypothetical protein